ncbi:DUF4309 domain-containing protein [Planococcus sp. YIM B11945]|uniref:DUF4309 domain-containing protein n=1 Tax=Planococcus sp. YIM B11945 TaxID=3435410 RepID=UPI003D7E3B8A
MINKIFAISTVSLLIFGLAACNDTRGKEAEPSHKTVETTQEQPKEEEEEFATEEAEADPAQESETNSNENTEAADSGDEISAEQKEMAIETLKGIVKDAENGIVYRFSDGFKVGESSRKEVYAAISEPEERLGDYDFYHGSMGQASYQIAYDDQDIMKEARYFGTNVERQTNLGGIAREDIVEHVGKPAEEREISKTGETNMIYFIGDYEVQFVLAKDGTTNHVNLLEKE